MPPLAAGLNMLRHVQAGGPKLALVVDSPYELVTYGELARRVGEWDLQLGALEHAVGWIIGATEAWAIAGYLAAFGRSIPVGLMHPAAINIDDILRRYRPSFVIQSEQAPPPEGYRKQWSGSWGGVLYVMVDRSDQVKTAGDLAVLLATSGSTGSPKWVRLSRTNLQSNAAAIADTLEIAADDVAMLSMPFCYAFGLSVINSHLLVGATIALTTASVMQDRFWQFAAEARTTTFSGVPHMYETLHRMNWLGRFAPPWRVLTQAGGPLSVSIVKAADTLIRSRGGRMYAMYGQTEATARISCVPWNSLGERPGSVGLPIAGGEIWLEPLADDSERSQLVYRGDNVMLGYAEARRDLSREPSGNVLRTGDIACCDAAGYYYITGRCNRIVKICGMRVDLSDLEREIARVHDVVCAAAPYRHGVFVLLESADYTANAAVRRSLAQMLRLPLSYIEIESTTELPRTDRGKIAYSAVKPVSHRARQPSWP